MLDDADDVELVRTTSFPDQSNGSLVFITTTSEEVAYLADSIHKFELKDNLAQDIWFTIRQVFFGNESISAELEVAGNKIAKNCRCRYVSLCKTLIFLSKSDKTAEEWSKIAADEEHPIFMVKDELSEVS